MENFFALLIGVGGDLPATVADASALNGVLTHPQRGGYLAENIEYLVNEHASRDRIISSFSKIIAKTNATEHATVIIYYSGHGLQIPRENDPSGFDYFLKTFGADINRPEETMLHGRIFSEQINDLRADRILVLLDCCHADGIKDRKISVFETIPVEEKPSNRALLEQLNSGEGRVFISACDDNEKSVILPGSQNSLFTEVILEVLNGNLSPSEEFVSAVDLIYFIVKEVPKRVLPFRHSQRPIVTEARNLSPDFYVCRNGKRILPNPEFEDFNVNPAQGRLEFIRGYDNTI